MKKTIEAQKEILDKFGASDKGQFEGLMYYFNREYQNLDLKKNDITPL